MAIVIQEVEAEVSTAEPTREEPQPHTSNKPSKRELALQIERQVAQIQRRNQRLLAD